MASNAAEECDNEQLVWLETLINKNKYDKSISRIINTDMKQAVPEGNNYASIISRATLNIIMKNGQKVKHTVIIKKAHVDEIKKKALEDIPVFKTEIMVYKDILTKCESLMNEYQDPNDTLWPDIIGYKPNAVIVFEDLKAKNFILADRTKLLDLNHASLVLHNLGRFHGLNRVLIKNGFLCKDGSLKSFLEIDSISTKQFFEGGLKVLSNVIEKYWSSEWKEIGERLFNEHKVCHEKIKKLMKTEEDTYLTLCHGDCWTSNMLFKYCPYDNTIPIDHKFLDYQTVHVNSYIIDIIHFLYSSVKPEVRRKHFHHLLNIYHKSLQSTLTIYELGHDVPTIEHIHAEAERVEYYGLAMTLLMLPITSAEIDNAFNIENLTADYNGMDAFNPELFKSDKFKSAVQPELIGWLKKGLF